MIQYLDTLSVVHSVNIFILWCSVDIQIDLNLARESLAPRICILLLMGEIFIRAPSVLVNSKGKHKELREYIFFSQREGLIILFGVGNGTRVVIKDTHKVDL